MGAAARPHSSCTAPPQGSTIARGCPEHHVPCNPLHAGATRAGPACLSQPPRVPLHSRRSESRLPARRCAAPPATEAFVHALCRFRAGPFGHRDQRLHCVQLRLQFSVQRRGKRPVPSRPVAFLARCSARATVPLAGPPHYRYELKETDDIEHAPAPQGAHAQQSSLTCGSSRYR